MPSVASLCGTLDVRVWQVFKHQASSIELLGYEALLPNPGVCILPWWDREGRPMRHVEVSSSVFRGHCSFCVNSLGCHSLRGCSGFMSTSLRVYVCLTPVSFLLVQCHENSKKRGTLELGTLQKSSKQFPREALGTRSPAKFVQGCSWYRGIRSHFQQM